MKQGLFLACAFMCVASSALADCLFDLNSNQLIMQGTVGNYGSGDKLQVVVLGAIREPTKLYTADGAFSVRPSAKPSCDIQPLTADKKHNDPYSILSERMSFAATTSSITEAQRAQVKKTLETCARSTYDKRLAAEAVKALKDMNASAQVRKVMSSSKSVR